MNAFETWVEMAEEQKETRAKCRKVVQRMLNASLVQVLQGHSRAPFSFAPRPLDPILLC